MIIFIDHSMPHNAQHSFPLSSFDKWRSSRPDVEPCPLRTPPSLSLPQSVTPAVTLDQPT
ncbi:hypothetical protein BCR44DRAFT_1448211 [Catenaria anguillulae PL171]|uniref:Uncharacterized protein n=1 Tax=Catenaria anguillulae PL171 TaxID=765915 RepID=A0A1Y2H6U1_9FUNG|nr:hypothetical protein BCR44DRAFT_1448211 [Catenaria anguillulae PL171]